jgi:hypothetical protein
MISWRQEFLWGNIGHPQKKLNFNLIVVATYLGGCFI